MSFNGSGVWSANSTGLPVVTGTVISSTMFNAFTADVATGLSTAVCKDGQQTCTAGVPFYAGTVSAPGIYLGTESGTGFYRTGANAWGFSINGTKALDLSATGTGFFNTVSYTAGDFTGSSSMTWTVDSGDVTIFQYALIGKLMFVNFALNATTVGGTPATYLYIKIPASKTANNPATGILSYNDNGGTPAIGRCYVNNGTFGANIALETLTGANWSAATNATIVTGQIFFETA